MVKMMGTAKAVPLTPRRHDGLLAFFCCLPAALVLLAFTYIPFLKALGFSFFVVDRNTFEPAKFYGLNYYGRIFNLGPKALGPEYLQSIGTTFLFIALVVPLGLVCALALARAASVNLKKIGLFRTLFSSPVAVSVASAGILWSLIYSPSLKLFQFVLDFLGQSAPGLLNSPVTALAAVALVTIWCNLGFHFLFALAGIQSIPPEILEASSLDGARGLRGFFKIHLPLLGPTILFLVITSTISCFQAFTQFKILLDGPGPDQSTNVFVFSIFNSFWMENNYGFASAMSMVLFLLIFLFSFLQFRMDQRVHYQ